MSLTRPNKKKRQKRIIQGDISIDSPAESAKIVDFSDASFVESLFDDDVQLTLLEQNEETLSQAEAANAQAMSEFKVLISPERGNLISAISTLQGEPSLVLDGKTLERALDLSLDSYIHSNGFNPVASALGLYGEEDGVPLSPVPRSFMTCEEMQNLDNVPSPEDSDYTLKAVDEISLDSQESKPVEILGKLWTILKYYPGVQIVELLNMIKISPIKKIVEGAIRWVNCNMVYPAQELLTGESAECSEGEGTPNGVAQDTLTEKDLAGRGMDCLEASAQVLNYADLKFRDNTDIRDMYELKEARAYHEASKFGTIQGSIKNRTYYAERIKKLQESTSSLPRYKKQYYDNKDNFSEIKTYQTQTLSKD